MGKVQPIHEEYRTKDIYASMNHVIGKYLMVNAKPHE